MGQFLHGYSLDIEVDSATLETTKVARDGHMMKHFVGGQQ